MPRLEGFTSGAYEAHSRHFNAQRCENLYQEINNSRTPGYPSALIGAPGIRRLKLRLTGDEGLPTFPLRALWAGHQRAFAVAGDTLYEVKHVTGAVDTDGTTVTWVAGPLFSDPRFGIGVPLIIHDVVYEIASSTDPTHLELSTDAGFQRGVRYTGHSRPNPGRDCPAHRTGSRGFAHLRVARRV